MVENNHRIVKHCIGLVASGRIRKVLFGGYITIKKLYIDVKRDFKKNIALKVASAGKVIFKRS